MSAISAITGIQTGTPVQQTNELHELLQIMSSYQAEMSIKMIEMSVAEQLSNQKIDSIRQASQEVGLGTLVDIRT